ncbi:hypothetical protein [Epilithonimonas mollis]|uniref:Uncharacterized protein n=1 Tax=Epilithonimonas mollis TaxID=216903 RepID=A0A1M6UKN6_9FLAO|nr:hypothetical protein [Epilithonimonas mollis]SHK69804.1 hypothetical protein SAMN05444371_3358 [Epilithonimonas mollis]
MAKFDETLLSLIKKIIRDNLILNTGVGTIKSVGENTCVIEREDLPDLEDVRLNSIEGNFENSFLIFPSVGSEVLFLMVENAPEENCIVKYSEIDKVKITVAGASFEMSAGKFEFKNDNSDLKQILSKTFDRLNSAIITTPNGPGKFSQPDKQFFLDQKTNTEKLFK